MKVILINEMFEKWYASLYSIHHKVIDPFRWRCACGYSWKFSRWQLILMLLKDDYVHTCPRCQRKSRYRMISHVVRDLPTEEIIENNKLLEDNYNVKKGFN